MKFAKKNETEHITLSNSNLQYRIWKVEIFESK